MKKKGLKISTVAAVAAVTGAVLFWKKKKCNKCMDTEEDELFCATDEDAPVEDKAAEEEKAEEKADDKADDKEAK